MDQILPWIVQLLGGAVGGNVIGKIFKGLSLGKIGNSIAGIIGGPLGAKILEMLNIGGAAVTGDLDPGAVAGNAGAAAAGGGVLMLVIGLVKKMFGGGKSSK